jgi:uncharacterized protein YggE
MSSQVTVSVRSLAVTLAGVLAVVAAYVVGVSARGGTAEAASSATVPTAPTKPRTIRMSGSGEVTGVPDQLAFHLTVTRTRADVAGAMDATSSVMARVLNALEGVGVQRKDTASTGLSVEPVYRYLQYDWPHITGYRVTQSADVLVRDLRLSGKAVTAAAHSGGNAVRLSGIKLRIGDVDALLARARSEAVQQATAKAEQYARDTHQHLGDVLTVRETGAGGGRPQASPALEGLARSSADGAVPVPVRAGRQQLKVMVGIVWQFR